MSTDIHVCQHNHNFYGKFLGKPGEECRTKPTLAFEEIQTPVFFSGLGGKSVMDYVMGWTTFYCEEHAKLFTHYTGRQPRPILPRDVTSYNEMMARMERQQSSDVGLRG